MLETRCPTCRETVKAKKYLDGCCEACGTKYFWGSNDPNQYPPQWIQWEKKENTKHKSG